MVRAFKLGRERVVTQSVSFTELVILFRPAFVRFSTEAYTSTFEVLQWSKFPENGDAFEHKMQAPTERLHTSLADRYSSSQPITAREIEGRS